MKKKLLLKSLRLSPTVLVSLFVLGVSSSFAQEYPPIGANYGATRTLIPPGSEDDLDLSQFVVVDITGNGLGDLIYTGYYPNAFHDLDVEPSILRILSRNEEGLLEDVAGTLLNGPVTRIPGTGMRLGHPADFNGDERLDLFISNQGPEPDCDSGYGCHPGGQNRLLLSGEDGKLIDVSATHLPQYSDFSHSASVADFDGDGDVDIWVTNLNSGDPNQLRHPAFHYLMFNDGDGHFTMVADFSGDDPEIPDVIIGSNGYLPAELRLEAFWSTSLDADGDGDFDIFLGFTSTVHCGAPHCDGTDLEFRTILINDGSGHFSILFDSPPPSELSRVWTQASWVYDLNGDGLDDLVLHSADFDAIETGNWGVVWIQTLISNGDGTFRDETPARFQSEPTNVLNLEFQLHDLDGDGHKDLLVQSDYVTDFRINDGEGNFRRLDSDWVATESHKIAILDVDGDSGTDIVYVTPGHRGTTLAKMNQSYGPELDGTVQDDRLMGGAHSNVLRGFHGNDVLDGGLGNDWLGGGEGSDELIGGKGSDGYAWLATELADDDVIMDKQGEDRLLLLGFGLEKISLASQQGPGDLLLDFTDGGSIRISDHFANVNYKIEWLQTNECSYRISNDPAFVSGDVTELLSGCVLHFSGFEETAGPEPLFTDPCDIGSGTWAVEARDCITQDCEGDNGLFMSWDKKIWCRALESHQFNGWTLDVPSGATTFDFWADWSALFFSMCGDGVTGVSIDSCEVSQALIRGGEEQHLTCDVTGESSVTIQKDAVECENVIIGDPFFH